MSGRVRLPAPTILAGGRAARAAVAGGWSSFVEGANCRSLGEDRGRDCGFDPATPEARIRTVAGTSRKHGGCRFEVECCCHDR